eukprot:Em0002g1353a
MSHLGIVSEPSNTVASKKKTSATGPIKSLPGTFTTVGSHKYLKKGAGNKWRNPSGSISSKKKSSQLNSECVAAAVRTNHTEVSGVSVDELGSEGNERASEMSDLTDLLCESTFRSMNHVRCQNSPSSIPATPMQEEKPEGLTTSRRMPYTNPSQIVRQEWGSEDREIPFTALPEIRQLRADLAQSEKANKDLTDKMHALIREQHDMESLREKERKEEDEARRIKDQEDRARCMNLLLSLTEMKNQHAAEMKVLRDQHRKEVEDLNNSIKLLMKELEQSTIQNQPQKKPSPFTETGDNKKKQTPELQELHVEKDQLIKGHKDVDKQNRMIPTKF